MDKQDATMSLLYKQVTVMEKLLELELKKIPKGLRYTPDPFTVISKGIMLNFNDTPLISVTIMNLSTTDNLKYCINNSSRANANTIYISTDEKLDYIVPYVTSIFLFTDTGVTVTALVKGMS